MNAKEKAKELIEKYLKLDIEIGGQYDGYLTMKTHDAKQCALIAVEEMIEYIKKAGEYSSKSQIEWWERVKSELQSL